MLIEKDQLLPFEEAKLYGHNAIHALMAYLGAFKGYTMMSQLRDDPKIMQIAEEAFIHESGAALIKKYSGFDELFTETSFRQYARDLLERMTNPYLEDTIQRTGRDPARKLGLNDRLFGAMVLCMEQGIEPKKIALGAAAGIRYLTKQKQTKFKEIESILLNLWSVPNTTTIERLILLVKQADVKLSCWCSNE